MPTIDWDNLPPCTGELVVSPHVCLDPVGPVTAAPTPLPTGDVLTAFGVALLAAALVQELRHRVITRAVLRAIRKLKALAGFPQ